MGSIRSSIVSLFLYYWVFILGALFAAKMLGYADNDRQLLIILGVVTAVYFLFQWLRRRGAARRGR